MPAWASFLRAVTISASITATVAPPLSFKAAMISRNRRGWAIDVPSARVLRISRGTGVSTPAWKLASIGEQFSGCEANRRGILLIWPAAMREQGENRVSEPRQNHIWKDEELQMVGWSGQLDSNQRPAVPKTAALPGCAIPRDPSSHGRYTLTARPARQRLSIDFAADR